FVEGVCFFMPDGTRVENFPELHTENCIGKQKETNNWFKHTGRIFKNLRNTLVDKGLLNDGVAPSYFIEGLLYNVPAGTFGGTDQMNFKNVLNGFRQKDRSTFGCANGQFFLFGNSLVRWPADNCINFRTRLVVRREGDEEAMTLRADVIYLPE